MRLIDADALKEMCVYASPCTSWEQESKLIDLIDAQPAIPAPRWVRCEDELPKQNIQCLVTDAEGNCAVGYYRNDAKAWDSPFFGWVERSNEDYYEDGDLCRIGKVVAWMPIEPPKEDA